MSQATKQPEKGTKKDQPDELGVKQLAERLKVDPKDLRKWLRSDGQGLGQRGKRYSFTTDDATRVAREYRKAQKES